MAQPNLHQMLGPGGGAGAKKRSATQAWADPWEEVQQPKKQTVSKSFVNNISLELHRDRYWDMYLLPPLKYDRPNNDHEWTMDQKKMLVFRAAASELKLLYISCAEPCPPRLRTQETAALVFLVLSYLWD